MKLVPINAKGVHNLYRHPVTDIVYFRQFRSGVGEITKSCRTKSLDEAKPIAEEYKRSFFENTGPLARGKRSAADHFNAWVERQRTKGKSPATMTSIEQSKKFFDLFFDKMFLDEITAEWWETVFIPETKNIRFKTMEVFGKKRRDAIRRSSDRRMFNDCKWLSSFLIQMAEDGAILKVPKLINPDPKELPGKVYSSDQIRQMLEKSDGDLNLAILMAATMGMRRGEIYGLEWKMVDLDKGTISLPQWLTKIRKARTFAISPAVIAKLRERRLPDHLEYRAYVFTNSTDQNLRIHNDSLKGRWTRLKEQLGISGRFHDLRHTFLTNAFGADGANPALICHFAGLSLETAIKVYLHFNENDSRRVAELVSYG